MAGKRKLKPPVARVAASRGKGLDEFIESKLKAASAALEATAHDLYAKDVRAQLGDSIRAGGDLDRAITASEAATAVSKDSEGNHWIGVGHIDTLNTLTTTNPGKQKVGHWAFLEYGTYDYTEEMGEWPSGSLRPADSAAAGKTDVQSKLQGKRGVAPNRAWRKARFMAASRLNERLSIAGFREANAAPKKKKKPTKKAKKA